MRESVIHLVQRMDDEVDRRPQRLLDGVGADQPFLGLRPIGGAIGQFLLADDHEDIVITLVLVRRQRRIDPITRSEEHTSELQSLMRISYAVFCLKKTTDEYRTQKLIHI